MNSIFNEDDYYYYKTEDLSVNAYKNYYKENGTGYEKVDSPNDSEIGNYYEKGILYEAPFVCYVRNPNDFPPLSNPINGIVLSHSGAENSNLKRYAQPYDGMEPEEERNKLIELIGENASNNGFYGADGELNNTFVNAIIGVDAKNKIRSLKIVNWKNPGNLLTLYDNYIQIMICESSNREVNRELYKEGIKLIAYLQQYATETGKEDWTSSITELEIDKEVISFSSSLDIKLSDVMKDLIESLDFTERDFQNDVTSITGLIKISNSDSTIPEPTSSTVIPPSTSERINYKIAKQEIIIDMTNKHSKDWPAKIDIPLFIPLIKKTYMQLAGTGISFYNETLYPREDVNYFNTGNFTKWNTINTELLSSLSFSDINALKENLINQNLYNSSQTINYLESSTGSSSTYGKNYLIYPVKMINLSQTYTGLSYDGSIGPGNSHYYHTQESPSYIDYPIDECGETDKEDGRSWFYCPCDEMKIVNIYGVGNPSHPNTIWLESTSKVVGPFGEDYVTIQITHPEDGDFSNLEIGQIFSRGQQMFREGKNGGVSGNHFHISVGTGHFIDPGWRQNNYRKWTLYTTGEALKPEEAFYIDTNFTDIHDTLGISFKILPIGEGGT